MDDSFCLFALFPLQVGSGVYVSDNFDMTGIVDINMLFNNSVKLPVLR